MESSFNESSDDARLGRAGTTTGERQGEHESLLNSSLMMNCVSMYEWGKDGRRIGREK